MKSHRPSKRIPPLLFATLAASLLAGTAPVGAEETAPTSPPAATAEVTAQDKAPLTDSTTVVATINDEKITKLELDRELEVIRQRFKERGRDVNDAQLEEIRGEVLDRMIRRELLYLASRDAGVTATDKEIEEGFQMVKARYADDEAFKKTLADLHLTEEIIRKDIGMETAVKKYIDDRFVNATTVTEEEAREYYDRSKENFIQPESVHASHILIKVEENASDEDKKKAREKIETIRKKLAEGADFAATAKESSEGPSAPKGGDLGYFRRGQMVKPFEDAAFALKKDEMSDVVETQFGYHLIKVHEKVEETAIAFADIKERIMEYLKKEKVQKQVNEFVESLRSKATIKLM